MVALISSALLLMSSLVPLFWGVISRADPQASTEDRETALVLLVAGAAVTVPALLMLVLAVISVVMRRPRLMGWGILPGLLGLFSSLLMFVPEAVFVAAFGVRSVFSVPASVALIVGGFVALTAVPARPDRRPSQLADRLVGGTATLVGALLAAAAVARWVAPAGDADLPTVFETFDWARMAVLACGAAITALAALATWRYRVRMLGWLVLAGVLCTVVTGYFLLGTSVEEAARPTDALWIAFGGSVAVVVVGFVALSRPRPVDVPDPHPAGEPGQ